MANPTIPLEWLYETLIKRCGKPYNIKLSELFLLVPCEDEAEFDYEIVPTPYYPLVPHGKLKVFFLKPSKLIATTGEAGALNKSVKNLDLSTPRILWNRKFNYPKISKIKSSKTLASFKKSFIASYN